MERECNKCIHKKEKGCEKWNCEFEQKYADPTEDAGTLAEQKVVYCNLTDAEIAKSFIEDVRAVENLLPRNDKKQMMLDELSKESEMVIATAYLYAKTLTKYGEDITKAWTTATQQEVILEKAYNDGYADAVKERFMKNDSN